MAIDWCTQQQSLVDRETVLSRQQYSAHHVSEVFHVGANVATDNGPATKEHQVPLDGRGVAALLLLRTVIVCCSPFGLGLSSKDHQG